MQASVPMVIAFAKAAEHDMLDQVSWTEKGITFTANLMVNNPATETLTYDLYEETLLVGTFEVAIGDYTVNYDSFLNLPFAFAPAPFNEVPMYNDCPTCGHASPLVTQTMTRQGLRKRRWACTQCGFQFITVMEGVDNV